MKVLICGARAWTDIQILWLEMDRLRVDHDITEVVVGGARGADMMAEEWARTRGIHGVLLTPDWDRHGRRAGFIRNIAMLDEKPDLVVAFLAGPSRGTWHTIKAAQDRDIEVICFRQEEG